MLVQQLSPKLYMLLILNFLGFKPKKTTLKSKKSAG